MQKNGTEKEMKVTEAKSNVFRFRTAYYGLKIGENIYQNRVRDSVRYEKITAKLPSATTNEILNDFGKMLISEKNMNLG